MFGWLVNLYRRWRDRDRNIFRYWDGARMRAIDPALAWRAIWEGCDLLGDAKVAANPLVEDRSRQDYGQPFYPVAEVNAANDRLRDVTRGVFDVQAWSEDEPGLTLEETDELLGQFIRYCEDLKKKRKPLPTSSAPSDSTEPASWPDTDDCQPGAESDSSCTPTASTAGAPTGH